MSTEKKAWHDNLVLVVILVVFIFPVGLYGLFKSKRISLPVKAVVVAGCLGLVAFLQFAGAQEAAESKALASAIQSGDLEALSANTKEIVYSVPVLYYAVENGSSETVTHLIDLGYEAVVSRYVSSEDVHIEYDAVYRAIELGKSEMVEAFRATGRYDIAMLEQKFAEAQAAEKLERAIANGDAMLIDGVDYWYLPIARESILRCFYVFDSGSSTTTMVMVYGNRGRDGITQTTVSNSNMSSAHDVVNNENISFNPEKGFYYDGETMEELFIHRGPAGADLILRSTKLETDESAHYPCSYYSHL